MDIRLDLTHHCIATETKKRYNRALSDYFRHKGDAMRLEAEIECLKTALERLDFPGLRNRYRELAGHNDADIILSCRPDGGLDLTVGGQPLDLMYLTPLRTV
jgi:hypothetical protein